MIIINSNEELICEMKKKKENDLQIDTWKLERKRQLVSLQLGVRADVIQDLIAGCWVTSLELTSFVCQLDLFQKRSTRVFCSVKSTSQCHYLFRGHHATRDSIFFTKERDQIWSCRPPKFLDVTTEVHVTHSIKCLPNFYH